MDKGTNHNISVGVYVFALNPAASDIIAAVKGFVWKGGVGVTVSWFCGPHGGECHQHCQTERFDSYSDQLC